MFTWHERFHTGFMGVTVNAGQVGAHFQHLRGVPACLLYVRSSIFSFCFLSSNSVPFRVMWGEFFWALEAIMRAATSTVITTARQWVDIYFRAHLGLLNLWDLLLAA